MAPVGGNRRNVPLACAAFGWQKEPLMTMRRKVMIAVLVAVSVGLMQVRVAIATTPQDPMDYIREVEPAKLSAVRDEVGQQVAKIVEELKKKPTEITPDTFARRVAQARSLGVLVEAWASGEMRVMTITGQVDEDWETKAWKPLSDAAVACANACDWLKANADEVLKKADSKNVRQMSVLEGARGIGLSKRWSTEAVALMAKVAQRNECVKDLFKKLGGTIEGCDPKVAEKLPAFHSAKDFIDHPHNIRNWVKLPDTTVATTQKKGAEVKESDQKLAKAAILAFYEAVNSKTPEAFDKLLSDPEEIAEAKASLEKVDMKVDTSKAVFTFVPDPAGTLIVSVDELALVNARNERKKGEKTFRVRIDNGTAKLRIKHSK